MSKKNLITLLMVFLINSPILFAQATARNIKLTIVGTDNKPLERVKITVTSPDIGDFRKEFFTDEIGQSHFLLPIQIKSPNFLLEKEGYQNCQESVGLTKMRNLKESFNYNITFILYRNDELDPQGEAKRNEAHQLALSFFNKGIEFFSLNKFPEAADQFEKAVEANPDFPEAHENLAKSYFQSGQYKEAIQAAKEALPFSSNPSDIINLISVAYSKLGEEGNALDYMNKLKELPDNQLSAEDLYNIAVQAAYDGNDTEAIEFLKRSTKRDPNFAAAHYQLGLCYYRLNDVEAAKSELKTYLMFESTGEKADIAKAILRGIDNKN